MTRCERIALLFALASAVCPQNAVDRAALDLNRKPLDPFASHTAATILVFVRTDCPITNRYAPELQRVANEFSTRSVAFWLVYPDSDETPEHIRDHMREYAMPGQALQDPKHVLVKRAHATVAPEAAVFDGSANLVYHGRIDDRYVGIGKTRPQATVHDLEDAIRAVLTGKRVAHAETRAVGCSLADVE